MRSRNGLWTAGTSAIEASATAWRSASPGQSGGSSSAGMPDFLRSVAPLLPTYHYAQLAWGAIGAASESTAASVAWLAGYTVALFGLAAWAYRRESLRKFA